MEPVRGTYSFTSSTSWRLDGSADPTAPLVLALHGMGMDEDSFAGLLAPLLAPPATPFRRVLTPRAPYPVATRGEGRIGGSWYAYDGDQERFRAELLRTEAFVLQLLADVEERHALKPRRRHLLGFSQGGYCGAFLALRHPELFDGLIVSGARVKTEFLEEEMPVAARRGFRVLLCHGRRDAAVPAEGAQRGRDRLAAAGVDVRLETFDAGHSLGRAQAEVMARWLEDSEARGIDAGPGRV